MSPGATTAGSPDRGLATAEIVVVGSINQDVSVVVERLPAPGETVLGGDALWSPGGKGANQAVAAARLGRRVAMVGAVGADPVGADLRRGLAEEGIGVDRVRIVEDASTGLAMIAVSAEGENSIVVSSGANARVEGEDVAAALAGSAAGVVLAQCEIPAEALTSIAAHGGDLRFVLNPAPATSLDRFVLDRVDVLVPNRGELARLLSVEPAAGADEVVDQARELGIAHVVVTLGGDGAVVVANGEVTHLPAQSVAVVDTTAAGDSFCGALADALIDGATIVEAAIWATRVAAVTVTRRGAQTSLPTSTEVGRC